MFLSSEYELLDFGAGASWNALDRLYSIDLRPPLQASEFNRGNIGRRHMRDLS